MLLRGLAKHCKPLHALRPPGRVNRAVQIRRSLVIILSGEANGKGIFHQPNAGQIRACRPWLEAEIKVVKPKMIVCLGATASQSLMGSGFRLTQHRGEILKETGWADWVLATVHPSSLLRMPDADARRAAREQFVADMELVARQLKMKGRRH